MTAVRTLIQDEVSRCLQTGCAAAEVELMPSGDPSRFPALQIFDEGDQPDEGEAGTSRWIMTLGIDGYVEGGVGSEALGALNELYADVVEALFAEPVLGGIATEIEITGFKPTVAERASARRMAFSSSLQIYYATRRGRPREIDETTD